MALASASQMDRISLCETLDRILTKGAVIAGEVIISVANVDLLYVGLQLVITSMQSSCRETRGLEVGLRGSLLRGVNPEDFACPGGGGHEDA